MSDSPRISDEANRHGVDPQRLLLAAAEDHRVLGVGECHFGEPNVRSLIAEIMPDLSRKNYKHLFIEAGAASQPALDELNRTGRITHRDSLPSLLQNDSAVNLLESAHRAGLQIHPVDEGPDSRNENMRTNIENVLNGDRYAKGLFIAGANHVQHTRYLAGDRYIVAAGGMLRRDGVPYYSAVEAREMCMDDYKSDAPRVKGIRAIETVRSPMLRLADTPGREWDAIIAFHGTRRNTIDLAHTSMNDGLTANLFLRYFTPADRPLITRYNLRDTAITDNVLPLFRYNLPNLKELDLRGTRVTLEGIANLQKAKPALRILHD